MRYAGGTLVESVFNAIKRTPSYDYVLGGGQTAGCSIERASLMLSASASEVQAALTCSGLAANDLAYILPRKKLTGARSLCANSIGGFSEKTPAAISLLSQYDCVNFRDSSSVVSFNSSTTQKASLVPDCAVLSKRFFAELTEHRFKTKVARSGLIPGRYIVIQMNAGVTESNSEGWAAALESLAAVSGLPLVLLRAGHAPGHDSLKDYMQIASIIPNCHHVTIFKSPHIFDICALIANAKLTVSTSLHVRVVSCAFNVPRISILNKPKVQEFMVDWEDCKDDSCDVSSITELCLEQMAGYDKAFNAELAENLADQYLDGSKNLFELL